MKDGSQLAEICVVDCGAYGGGDFGGERASYFSRARRTLAAAAAGGVGSARGVRERSEINLGMV